MKLIPQLSPTSWLTAKTAFSQAFAVALFAIQAPLLGPRAFGMVSIVMVFVGFCETVLGETASESLIAVRAIERSHFDTMNSVNVLISAAFGAAIFLGAPRAAQLFADAELVPIFRWMALLPMLSALSAAPTASTKRDMQFGPLALRSIVSQLAGGIVGLVLTLLGFGVWALVWQAIVMRLTTCLVLWQVVPLRLGFAWSRRDLGELSHFAVPLFVSRTLSWATGQFPRLVFGLYWGPTELGIFGLASRLCDVLLELVITPRYAVARLELRAHAADRAGLAAAMDKLLLSMSVFAFPLCVGGAAVAPTLFHAWLDARWLDGIVPAEWLMLMCVPLAAQYCVGAALLALNQQRAESVSSASFAAVTVAAVLVFAPFGLVPASAAYALRPLVLLPLAAWLLQTRCRVPARVLWSAQRPALIAAGVMALAVTLLRLWLEPSVRSVLLLPVLVAAGALTYVAMIGLLLPQFARRYLGRFA